MKTIFDLERCPRSRQSHRITARYARACMISSPTGGSANPPGSTDRCRPFCLRMAPAPYASSLSGLHPVCAAPTEPAGPSPATMPATCSTARSNNSDSPAAISKRGPTTAWNLSAQPSPTRFVAFHPRTSRSDPRSRPAAVSWHQQSRIFQGLRAILTLGVISHQSTVRALGDRIADLPFRHGARHEVGKLTLFSSYHCSRYNTNTGRLTQEMFVNVFREIADFLEA